MKIIVTGGAGFIASHVVDAYIKAGHAVVAIDDLSAGSRKNLNPRAKFYKADIRDRRALERIFKKERPRLVNHHAAWISVMDSIEAPQETFERNITGTLNLLITFAKIKTAGPKKFIFASSGGAIYGEPKKVPADESTPPNLLSPYALTKQIGEEMVRYFSGMNGITYLILRYANVYGPRQRALGGAGVFPAFTKKIRNGLQPVIFGDGKKTRDYVYVEDVARANALGLSRGKNETVNIATSRQKTDLEVFRAVAQALGYEKGPHFGAERKGEVQKSCLSNAKAKKILGWEPKMSFEEGVARTVRGL